MFVSLSATTKILTKHCQVSLALERGERKSRFHAAAENTGRVVAVSGAGVVLPPLWVCECRVASRLPAMAPLPDRRLAVK